MDWRITVGSQLIPPKIVDNRFYPQAKKEAIVIKLGKGRGDNWFCAMFPHTCELEKEERPKQKRSKVIVEGALAMATRAIIKKEYY